MTVENGATLRVVQLKNRDGVEWITYEISMSRTLPRRMTMRRAEFDGIFQGILK